MKRVFGYARWTAMVVGVASVGLSVAAPVKRGAPLPKTRPQTGTAVPVQEPEASAPAVAGAKALAELARAATKAGDYTKAVQYYADAIALTPRDANLYVDRGASYVYLKLYDQAVAEYTKALALNPRLARAYLFRAAAYSWMEKRTEAISDTEAGLKIEPDNADLLHTRQVLRVRFPSPAARDLDKAITASGHAGNLAEALRLAVQMIALEPTFPRAHLLKGFLEDRAQQYDQALIDIDAALKLDPLYADAWGQKYTTLIHRKEYIGALLAAQHAMALDPKDGDYRNSRGVAYSFLDDTASAYSDFRVAAGLSPDNKQIAENLATAKKSRDAAIQAATPPARQATRVAAGGRSCRDILYKLVTPMNVGNPFTVSGWEGRYSMAHYSEMQLWGQREYIRLADAVPICQQDMQARQDLMTELNGALSRCQQNGCSDSTNGRYYGISLVNERAAFDAIVRENSAVVPPSAAELAADQRKADGEHSCVMQTDAIAKQIDTANRQPIDPADAVTPLERMMWGTKTTIDIVARTCPASSSFSTRLAAYRSTYAQAAEVCSKIATGGQCTPRLYPPPPTANVAQGQLWRNDGRGDERGWQRHNLRVKTAQRLQIADGRAGV